MVLTSNGLVLTNNHVVEGETSISVTDIGNHRTYSATVVRLRQDEGCRSDSGWKSVRSHDSDLVDVFGLSG